MRHFRRSLTTIVLSVVLLLCGCGAGGGGGSSSGQGLSSTQVVAPPGTADNSLSPSNQTTVSPSPSPAVAGNPTPTPIVVSGGGFQLTIPAAAISSGSTLTITPTNTPSQRPMSAEAKRTTTAVIIGGDITCGQNSTLMLDIPDTGGGNIIAVTDASGFTTCLEVLDASTAKQATKQTLQVDASWLIPARGPYTMAVYLYQPKPNEPSLQVVAGDASQPQDTDWYYLDIHGIQSDGSVMAPLAQWQFDNQDCKATLVFTYDFTESPKKAAEQLAALLHRTETPLANRAITIAPTGHSFGGDVLLYFAHNSRDLLGREVAIATNATLSTPYLGAPVTLQTAVAWGLNGAGNRGAVWNKGSVALKYIQSGTPEQQSLNAYTDSLRLIMVGSSRYPRSDTTNPIDFFCKLSGAALYGDQPNHQEIRNDGVVSLASAQPTKVTNGLVATNVTIDVPSLNHFTMPDAATVGPKLAEFLPWPFGKSVRRITSFPDASGQLRSGLEHAYTFPQSLSATGRFGVFVTSGDDYSFLHTPVANIVLVDLQTGQYELVSQGTHGEPANDDCNWPSISGDGHYVLFSSKATNIVAANTGGFYQVYLRDRYSNTTKLVSATRAGQPGNADSGMSPSTSQLTFQNNVRGTALSPNAQWAAYASYASNLVDADTNGFSDVFVWNRVTGATERVSKTDHDQQTNGDSYWVAIADDGQNVVYHTDAHNIFSNIDNYYTYAAPNCVIYNRTTQTAKLLCRNYQTGEPANNEADLPVLSGNGRYVVYLGFANDTVPNDTNGTHDIFVYDTQTDTTERISVAPGGGQWPYHADSYSVSYDGTYVAMSLLTKNEFDPPLWGDIFVCNRRTRQTKLVSLSALTGHEGEQSNNLSRSPAISGDGHTILFSSAASNFAPGSFESAIERMNLYTVGNPWVR